MSQSSRPSSLLLAVLLAFALGDLGLALTIGLSASHAAGVGAWADDFAAPSAAAPAEWTVLVYMDGGNNLEATALTDLRRMARVGSSAQLAIVAQLARVRSDAPWDDASAGDWVGARRFLVRRGMEPDAAAAVEDLGAQAMGDPATLAEFVSWGVRAYPARRYALVLWGHGAGWQGLTGNVVGDSDSLSLPELRAALATAHTQPGGATLDLIGFDSCLMGQLDVLQTIAPYADIAVASANLVPTRGWAWDAWLSELRARPARDAAAVAGVIVDSYMDAYQGNDTVTLAAFDLAQVGPLSARLDSLAAALLEAPPADYAALAEARAAADTYAPDSDVMFYAVDLGRLAQLLTLERVTGEVGEAAAAVGEAIARARLAYGAGEAYLDDSGLSIYFPPHEAEYLPAYERASPGMTLWTILLQAYYHSPPA